MKNPCNRLILQYFNATENPKEPIFLHQQTSQNTAEIKWGYMRNPQSLFRKTPRICGRILRTLRKPVGSVKRCGLNLFGKNAKKCIEITFLYIIPLSVANTPYYH